MESRKRIDMTSGEFAWTAAGILGLGVLAGWALFGTHRMIDWVFETGNAAEWLAAIGTWVIGMGAWKYARDSFMHHAKRAEAAEHGAINGILWKAQRAKRMKATSERILKQSPRYSNELFRHAMKFNLSVMSAVKWTETEKSYLSRETLRMLGSLEHSIFTYLAFATEAHAAVPNDLAIAGEETSDAAFAWFKQASNHALTAYDQADELIAALDRAYPKRP